MYKQILTYCIIAYLVTWTIAFKLYFLFTDGDLTQVQLNLYHSLAALGPAIGALIITYFFYGKSGLARLLAKLRGRMLGGSRGKLFTGSYIPRFPVITVKMESMLRIISLTCGLCVCTTISTAQTPCACCTESHSQFDFWVGDWTVYDTAGNIVGENLIEKLEDNCIVNEHWKGAQGGTGRSYNYYDAVDSTWNQLWIDNSGSNLILKGAAEADKMILKSELIQGKKVDWYRNRITWTNNPDGTVTQLWEILDKNDKLLSVAFKGIYKKK